MQKENDLIQRNGTIKVFRIIGFIPNGRVLIQPFDVRTTRDMPTDYISLRMDALADYETLSLNAIQISEDGSPWDHAPKTTCPVYVVHTCRSEWRAPPAMAVKIHACNTETEAISKLYWLYKNRPDYNPAYKRSLMRYEVPGHTLAMKI